jgi:asparagine synthase (glutamine-hydrolysing)
MFYDQSTYLQSVLDRNDRMTMAASIECRVPFLDYRLVEWAAGVPTRVLFKHGVGKSVVRGAMAQKLPPNILQRRKWGFAVPWHRYLRDVPSLRRFVENLHTDSCIKTMPVTMEAVRERVQSFLNGNDRLTPFVTQLVFTSVWYHLCALGESKVFD